MTLKTLLATLEGEPKAKLEAALAKKEEARQKYKRLQLKYGYAKSDVRRVNKELENMTDELYTKSVRAHLTLVQGKFNLVDAAIYKYRRYDKQLKDQLKLKYLSKKKLLPADHAGIADMILRYASGLGSYAFDASDSLRISKRYYDSALRSLKYGHDNFKRKALLEQRVAEERLGIMDGSRLFYDGLLGHIQMNP